MLRIIEVKSEEQLTELRANENNKFDYLYILKYINQLKMSDNGTLKNLTNVRICTQKEYDNITEKENILYVATSSDKYKIYFNTILINETYTDEELNDAINSVLTDETEGE